MDSKQAAFTEDEFSGRLGVRLRHARLAHRWTLKEVANKVGCSESLVSKIERGRIYPSLKILHQMTGVLDTSIGALLASGETETIVWRAGKRPVITLQGPGQAKHIHLERIVPHQPGLLLEANIHIVEPGAESDGAIEHSGEEVGYLLHGKLELWVDGRLFRLEPGDAFYFRSDLGHYYRNPGIEVAKVFWVNSPPTF